MQSHHRYSTQAMVLMLEQKQRQRQQMPREPTLAAMPVPRSSRKESPSTFVPPKAATAAERARQSRGMVRAKGITIRHHQRKTASDSAAASLLWLAIQPRLKKASAALLMTFQAMDYCCCFLAGVVAAVAAVAAADRSLWAERKTTRQRHQQQPAQASRRARWRCVA